VQGEALEEAVQGVGTSIGEVGAEAVTADVFHLVLVWKRGDGALWVFAAKVFVEEDEVGEAATDFDGWTRERCKVGL